MHLKPAAASVLLFPCLMLAAPPTTNPADLDRAAVDLMMMGLNEDKVLGADDLNAVPLDDALAEYLEQRKPILDLLREAAKLPKADWGPVDADISKVMTSLNGARAAAQLTWISARYLASQGKHAEAVDDMLAGLALARHVGQLPLLVCRLVSIGIESGADDRLAALLLKLPAEVAKMLPAKFDALPKASTLAEVIEGERVFGRKMLEQQFANTDVNDRAMGTKMADGMTPLYDAMKAAADKSPAEFGQAIDDALAKLKDNTLAQVLGPSVKRMREPDARVQAKTAMLRTAIAITADGPAALAKSQDPFGPGPFVRSDSAKGYTLASALPADKQGPVSLTIEK